MSGGDLAYSIAIVVLLLICGTNGVLSLIKWVKERKYDANKWKARREIVADLLAKGVEIPKQIIIDVLLEKGNVEDFSRKLASLDPAPKKKGK